MHAKDLSRWSHQHHYAYGHERESERKMSVVVAMTGAMMIVEIVCGWVFNSLALLADGWHMATHTLAVGVGVYAYRYARVNAHNPKYSFGTGKVHALSSYTSALFLAVVAALVLADSIWTLFNPKDIQYNEALLIAAVGFVVNAVSIKLLHSDHEHHTHSDHEGHHDHSAHEGQKHDHNLKAAYAHVVVDAMTSIFAIVALLVGKYLGWAIVDPIVGVIGAVVIAQWAYSLLTNASSTLLDRQSPLDILEKIRTKIQADGDSKISDLHVWQVAPGRLSAIVSIVAHEARPADEYKGRLHDLDLAHVTIELNHCCTMH